MRQRTIFITIVLCLLIQLGCTQRPTPYFAPPAVVQNVYNHIVSISVYYYMPEQEWQKRMYEDSIIQRVPLDTDDTFEGKPIKVIAYIGSGTILKDNHILTVRHLFDATENTYDRQIWVFIQDVDHPIKADLIAMTKNDTDDDYFNDYAVIKMREDVGLPGLPIAETDVVLGEKVMFGCSVGGTAFFLRFGYASQFKWFFRRDAEGVLHLSKWVEYHFLTVTPSGPGDSGSSVTNIKGEIVGIVYLGTEVYSQLYGFSNPISMLWDFLCEYHLEYLG